MLLLDGHLQEDVFGTRSRGKNPVTSCATPPTDLDATQHDYTTKAATKATEGPHSCFVLKAHFTFTSTARVRKLRGSLQASPAAEAQAACLYLLLTC
jgi:hypothetical protein